MAKIYLSKTNNPYFNVALEKHLFDEQFDDLSLYLWVNRKSVIFGRNQNVYAECDTEYLKNNNISPVRRYSGGGAVYQDEGNLNFTFVTKTGSHKEEEFLSIIKDSLLSLGIEITMSGRNDILVGDKKISGQAYLVDEEKYMYHGTIMVDVDLETLVKSLTPSKLKLESKGIESVRSRVINLCDIDKTFNIETVKTAIIKTFKNSYNVDGILEVDEGLSIPGQKLISSDKWIYGECPYYNATFEKKLSIGNVSLFVEITNGIIEKIKIYSDTLNTENLSLYEKNFLGQVFNEDKIFEYIENKIGQKM